MARKAPTKPRTYDVTCAGCGKTFTAKSPRARWHSAACRKRHQRAATAADQQAEAPTASEVRELEPGSTFDWEAAPLVTAISAELETAGKLATWKGQQALALARRLANPDESGAVQVSKELDRVMAEALGTPAAPAPTTEPEPEDEVERARRAREEARQKAGLS